MRTLFLLLSFSFLLHSQTTRDLMPVNLQTLYQAQGTRQWNGTPSEHYWINGARYHINVYFEPTEHTLVGQEEIVYYNNSPDSLHALIIKVNQDNRRLGNMRDWPVDHRDIHHGMDMELLLVNGQPYYEDQTPGYSREGTNLHLFLTTAIAPGDSAHLTIYWITPISRYSNMRNGCYDSTSCFVAYWYPQIAVYDDLDGWDRYSYTGVQEMYNDFNDYHVAITVPDSFMVWATGILTNGETLFQPAVFQRIQQAMQSDTVLHIINEDDYVNGTIFRQSGKHTFHYTAHQVPDFAFAVATRYRWDATSYAVTPQRRTFISAAYKPSSIDFQKVAWIARKSVQYYSQQLPGVPFPYPSLTIFNGRGGMEYPMMVNDGSAQRWASTVHVTSHEICHTYFPFYMGINERKYAWMDEGWATMIPFELQSTLAQEYDPLLRTIKQYQRVAGSEMDMPMRVPTVVYKGDAFRPAYRNESYNRPGIAYYLLQQLMGADQFKTALQEYIKRWHHKHPLPFDFFFTMEDVYGQDLSWFWKPWFFDFGYPDLALSGYTHRGNKWRVKVEKKGNFPVPVNLVAMANDSSLIRLNRSITAWKKGQRLITLTVKSAKPLVQFYLDNAHIPDINVHNDTLRVKR